MKHTLDRDLGLYIASPTGSDLVGEQSLKWKVPIMADGAVERAFLIRPTKYPQSNRPVSKKETKARKKMDEAGIARGMAFYTDPAHVTWCITCGAPAWGKEDLCMFCERNEKKCVCSKAEVTRDFESQRKWWVEMLTPLLIKEEDKAKEEEPAKGEEPTAEQLALMQEAYAGFGGV
jgi:hypothetical protein